MEMSVKAGGNSTTMEQPAERTRSDRRNASELDAWLERAEAMGELKRITAEVSPDLEAAHITYLVGLTKNPALLFENIKGHPGHKVLYNMIGCNLSRFCLMIGEDPVDHPLKAVQLLQKKFGRKMARRLKYRPIVLFPVKMSSKATRSTSANFRRSGCGRLMAACISAPMTLSSPKIQSPAASTSAPIV
jgi:3-octaprenyl-4-hydroxybenzoate carboxy-lyase